MAAKYRNWTPEVVKKRIRTGVLAKRLMDHALGAVEMTPTQVKAAEILLRKVMPDMKATEHSGTVTKLTYDMAVVGLIERGTEARDAGSAEPTAH
jgi:hypothetical protein